MKKLFVGNLSWKVTEDSLKSLFETIGEVVSVKIISDQYTGKSKGFGFVEMARSEDAQRAIQELHDKPLLERNLRVSLAQERSERDSGSRDRRDSRGGDSRGDSRGGDSRGESRGGPGARPSFRSRSG